MRVGGDGKDKFQLSGEWGQIPAIQKEFHQAASPGGSKSWDQRLEWTSWADVSDIGGVVNYEGYRRSGPWF